MLKPFSHGPGYKQVLLVVHLNCQAQTQVKGAFVMGRYSQQTSYAHNYKFMGYGWYRIYWTVDRYVKGSRLRFPTQYSRDTDEAGVKRFCKRWKLAFAHLGQCAPDEEG